ncbi:MAG: diguanylate cyclase [Chitinivibrionales bacterium]|nr:diguanylate cyclase [Chitinivibrionales bacterium]
MPGAHLPAGERGLGAVRRARTVPRGVCVTRTGLSREQLEAIVNQTGQGIVLLDRQCRVVYWNRFMEMRSARRASEVIGRSLFELFPELPENWLRKKVESVFVLRNVAFTSWLERPYLIRLQHNRPITGGVDCMRQDTSFFAVSGADGEPEYVCVAISDATDTALYDARLREALAKVEELSERDALTGWYNRRRLEELLTAEANRAQRYGTPFSIILFDLDHFKDVNDTHGHLAGDEILKETTQRVRGHLRVCDMCARYGGEEFLIMLPQTSEKDAAGIAERIRTSVASEPIACDDVTVPITICLGVCDYARTGGGPQHMIECVDKALYAAKRGGRNRTVLYSALEPSSGPEPVGCA